MALVYMLPAIIILQGATIAGLGLALATWISRTGRAVAWTISALIASVIGWPIIAIVGFGDNLSIATGVMVMGSPFYNVGFTTNMIEQQPRGFTGNDSMERGVWIGMIVWLVVYALMAVGFYLATLLTFERALGRTPEGAARPDPRSKAFRSQRSAVSGQRSAVSGQPVGSMFE